MWLTRLALRNPVLILMMSLMMVVLGFVVAAPAQRRSVPRHQRPGHPRRDLLHGRRPGRHREDRSPQPIERAVGASPGVDRVESTSQAGRLARSASGSTTASNLDNAQFEVSQRVAQILNTLPPGIQQPFIIKFDITNIPVVAGRGQRRRARRAAALRSRLQHHRAAARAHPRRRQRQRRRRQDPRDRGQGRTATRCARAASASSTSSTRSRASNLLLPSGDLKRRRPRLQRLHQHAGRRRRARSSDVDRAGRGAATGGGQAGARRCASRDVAEVEDGTRRISPRSCASTASAASTCACSSSRAPTPSRSSTPSARRCRSCAACRPT